MKTESLGKHLERANRVEGDVLAVGEDVIPPRSDRRSGLGQDDGAEENGRSELEHLLEFGAWIDEVFEDFERGEQFEVILVPATTSKPLCEEIFAETNDRQKS